MIRLVAEMNGKPTVILGLEPENLRRMQEGKPIKVNLRDLDPHGPSTGLPDIDVLVCAEDTDDFRAAMATLLRSEQRPDGAPDA